MEDNKYENVNFSKFPLKNEIFHLKNEIGKKIIAKRAELRQANGGNRNTVEFKPKTGKRRPASTILSIAASVVVIACVASYFLSNVNLTTGDKPLAVILPDNSKVDLAANSDLSYNKLAWIFVRNVELNGEARFEVEKGSQFTVATIVGDVSVLGTKFQVKQKGDNMRVECFEGSVGVKAGGECVLNAGQWVECSSTSMGKVQEARQQKPEFVTYNNEPLINVINEIERDYKISFFNKAACDGLTFTGLYPTTDLTNALDIVLGSCGLNYSQNGSTIEIIK